MRAIVCEKLGDPRTPLGDGVLSLRDVPLPEKIQLGFLRVKVTAAGLNFPDALIVKGEYQDKPPLPFTPGSEVSGHVVALGPGVKGFAVGDAVVSVVQRGGFAEVVDVPALATWVIPAGVDVGSAAGLPITFGTSHLALVHQAGLRAGQVLLVLGASGGVGTAAVQIGKLLGAKVVAVTRGSAKVAYLQALGADAVIDTAAPSAANTPLHKLIKAAAPKGVNVVYDPVGGPSFTEALKCVSWGAHYLVIGFAAGSIPKVPLNLLLVKNTTLHGVFWGSYLTRDYKVLAGGLRQLLAWLAEGKLRVMVSHRFPLSQLPHAMACLLDRQVQGKILIMTQEPTTTSSSSSSGGTGIPVSRSRL